MKEEWKDIQGYEGAYKVSNTGKIMSLNYHGSGKSKELISSKPKKGYPYVGLCKGGKVKSFKVHRLVAQAFIPNLDNKPCVNHKDGNKITTMWITLNGQQFLRIICTCIMYLINIR